MLRSIFSRLASHVGSTFKTLHTLSLDSTLVHIAAFSCLGSACPPYFLSCSHPFSSVLTTDVRLPYGCESRYTDVCTDLCGLYDLLHSPVTFLIFFSLHSLCIPTLASSFLVYIILPQSFEAFCPLSLEISCPRFQCGFFPDLLLD